MTAAFNIIEHTLIPLNDGRNLAARIWMPATATSQPVPAILEYLPYRKRDGTAPRDDITYPAFAVAGYAGVRVDISGTGESDGDYDDEYSAREHADALQVIDWIGLFKTFCASRKSFCASRKSFLTSRKTFFTLNVAGFRRERA